MDTELHRQAILAKKHQINSNKNQNTNTKTMNKTIQKAVSLIIKTPNKTLATPIQLRMLLEKDLTKENLPLMKTLIVEHILKITSQLITITSPPLMLISRTRTIH